MCSGLGAVYPSLPHLSSVSLFTLQQAEEMISFARVCAVWGWGLKLYPSLCSEIVILPYLTDGRPSVNVCWVSFLGDFLPRRGLAPFKLSSKVAEWGWQWEAGLAAWELKPA
jgi:hypothetical protein